MNIKIKSVLPSELLAAAIGLDELGIWELAWVKDRAIDVIIHLSKLNYAILGGDVYKITSKVPKTTCDSWYSKRLGEKREDFVNRSKQEAIDYISMYHSRNGEGFCYSIVYE